MSVWLRHPHYAVVLAFLAANCAPTRVRLAAPVGPAPLSGAGRDIGRLIVFTQLSHAASDDYEHAARVPYDIFDSRGIKIARVTSHDTTPTSILLSDGDYIVRASAFGRPRFDVGVRVIAGRTTEVRLDGATVPEEERKEAGVYAPNGAFMGWRAEP